eukprot:UN03396
MNSITTCNVCPLEIFPHVLFVYLKSLALMHCFPRDSLVFSEMTQSYWIKRLKLFCVQKFPKARI